MIKILFLVSLFIGIIQTESNAIDNKPQLESSYSMMINSNTSEIASNKGEEANCKQEKMDGWENHKHFNMSSKSGRHGYPQRYNGTQKPKHSCHKPQPTQKPKPTIPKQQERTKTSSSCSGKYSHRGHRFNNIIQFFRRSLIAKFILFFLCVGILVLLVWLFVKLYNRFYFKKQTAFYARLKKLLNEEVKNPGEVANDFSNVMRDDFQVINYDNESNMSPIPEQYNYQQMN